MNKDENYEITEEEMEEVLSLKKRKPSLSISDLQKHFGYGYKKAAYIFHILEAQE